jgi:hypothetical protein
VVIKSFIVSPHTLLKANRRFGETFSFHHQGQILRQARKQDEARSAFFLLHTNLSALLFNPEHGANIFFGNVNSFSTD